MQSEPSREGSLPHTHADERPGSGSPLVHGRGIWIDAAEFEAWRQLRIELLRQVTNRNRRILRFRGVRGTFERYPAMVDRYPEVERLVRFWTLQGRLRCAEALTLREAARAAMMLSPGIPELEQLARWLGLLPPREEAA